MGIEHFKRWHWVVLGALVGVAMAYMWVLSTTSVEGGSSGRDDEFFERDIVLKDAESGKPLISGIVIHPTEESFRDGEGKPTYVNVVTYKRLAKDRQGRFGWLNKRIIVKNPFKPRIEGRVAEASDLTIEKYLRELSRTSGSDTVRYRYGWWMEPQKAMILGSVAGVVLIGGLWPSLLGVMVGAGLGRKYDPEEEAQKARQKKEGGFDWGSLLRTSKKSADARGGSRATAQDQRELQAIADAYEKNLGHGAHAGAGAAVGEAQAEGDVRKLEGGTLEAAKPMSRPGDDDEIEVKGEYYPVLIHHKKQQDDQKKDQKPDPDQKK